MMLVSPGLMDVIFLEAKFFIHALQDYLEFLNSVVSRYAELLKFVFKKQITLEDLFGKGGGLSRKPACDSSSMG